MNALERIRNHRRELTSSEIRLADHIERNYPQALLSSATTIAKDLGISPSTVVRLFPKLGYGSFMDAQMEARHDIAQKLASPAERASVPISGNHLIDALNASIQADQVNISLTRELLDLNAYTAMVERLCGKDRGTIYLVGAKNSQSIAIYLYTHLNLFMPQVQLVRFEGVLHADQLQWASEKDTLIAISIRRYTRATIHVARHFRKIGACIFTLVDSNSAPLARLADHSLLFQTASASPFDSFVGAIALCNALIAGITSRNAKEVRRTLQRGDTMWADFDLFE